MLKRKGFTLIEVMISVLIITTVVMALYAMNGNTNFMYEKALKSAKYTGYLSFLVGNQKYGFESDTTDVEELLEGFELEDELRRKLKEQKFKIAYDIVEEIDLSEFDFTEDAPEELQDDLRQSEQSTAIFEVGRSSIVFDDESIFISRIRVP